MQAKRHIWGFKLKYSTKPNERVSVVYRFCKKIWYWHNVWEFSMICKFSCLMHRAHKLLRQISPVHLMHSHDRKRYKGKKKSDILLSLCKSAGMELGRINYKSNPKPQNTHTHTLRVNLKIPFFMFWHHWVFFPVCCPECFQSAIKQWKC